MNTSDLNGQWLDFYALIGVAPDADKETLRRAIGAAYANASANCDHRDLSRRHYFQTMVERVLPQARRVLLDADSRQSYDEQNLAHKNNGQDALDYVSFMAALQSGVNPKTVASAASAPGEFDSLPERVQEEITLARAVLECVQSGSEFDLLPAKTLSASSSDVSNDNTPPVETAHDGADETDVPDEGASPTAAASIERLRRRMTDSVDTTYFGETPAEPIQTTSTQTSAPSASRDATTFRAATAAPENPIIVREVRAKTVAVSSIGAGGAAISDRKAAAAAAIADAGRERIGARSKTRDEEAVYKPRVVVGDDEETIVKSQQRRALLSPLATHLLTAIASALLIFTVFHFTNGSAAAPVARLPLTVMYSSNLRTVMEASEAQFEQSAEGAGVDVVLQPMDARSAMRFVLDGGKNAPDVWIPSETMWSNRYNEVAPRRKKRVISSSTPLALSPLVLVARSDQASSLRQEFPTRKIDNWDALRKLVGTNCAGHFGLTDPQKAGSGALARFVMARDWSERNRVPWNAKIASDAKLWQWMKGFEDNVPEYQASGDMVKDLALGTTGQYWWCLAYESDAIYWISQGKKVEIFYLPGTHYANHPFCHVEREGATRETTMARARFEKFLHTTAIQSALLKNGFRPPEIDLSRAGEGNPFQAKSYAERGVRAEGFQAGGRLDYRTINALTAQWAKRYSS